MTRQNFLLKSFINKVICGDRVDIMKRMPKSSIHLIITSPPYNVGIPYENHDDLLSYEDYLSFLNDTWKACYRVLVKGGRICINVPSVTAEDERGKDAGKKVYQPLFCDVVNQMRKIGYIMRCEILWYKQNISKRTAWGSWMSPSNPYVVQPYEFVLVFSKEDRKLIGDKDRADISREEFINFSNSFWDIKPQTQRNGHPAPFPEELIYRLIKFYSYKENIILDPFAGGGTVGVVARKTDRNYICIDKSEKYCKLSEKNIKSADFSCQLHI